MLAAIKLGVVVIPATTLLTPDELQRPARSRPGQGGGGVAGPGREICRPSAATSLIRIVVGASSKHEGWLALRTGGGVSRSVRRRTGRPEPTIRCCCISRPAPPQSQNWCGIASAAIRSARLSTMYWLGLAAGRHPSEHFLAGLGQACLELLLRAVECRRHGVRGQPAALRCQGIARDHRPLRRHHAVRAADGVAAVHPGEAGELQGVVARGLRRRRAAQSRSDRSGQRRLGADDPRRLWPDRNHGIGRQFAGADGEGRIDGPAAAGLSRADHRQRRQRHQGGRGQRWCSAPTGPRA